MTAIRARRWLATATGLVMASGALAALVAAPVQAADAEASLDVTTVQVGGTLRISGTGWTHPSPHQGSTIALKIESVDPAFPLGQGKPHKHVAGHVPVITGGGGTETPATGLAEVWQVIQAEDDGSFQATITLPDGTATGPQGSCLQAMTGADCQTFGAGRFGVRLLTGSLQEGDTGRSLKLLATATPKPVVKPPTTPAPKVLTIKGKPKVKGKAKVGRKLKVAKVRVTPGGAKLKYRWLRNGTAIKGKKGARKAYRVTRKDKGKKLSVRVTAQRSGFKAARATSRKFRVK